MTLSVAIVGAGPAGFYTAEALLETVTDIEIDIIERLPSPFGLIRAGVAPDHQSTKQVARKFELTALRRRVQFFGNVEIGRDLSLEELRSVHDAVVLAIGSPLDRPLGIRGEEKLAVYGSSIFVGWYNGHPDFHDLWPRLRTPTAVVIGNGNVALDVARLLLKSPMELAASDIPEDVANALANSGIRDVYLVGRRGPNETKFSLAELREMEQIKECDLVLSPRDFLHQQDPGWTSEQAVETRALRVLREFLEKGKRGGRKRLIFRFHLAPVEIVGGTAVEGVRFEETRTASGRVVGTGRYETIACGLVIAAIGYRMAEMMGVPFDCRRGLITNDDGRIAKGLYVVGWAKRGPVGVIGSNKPDGRRCAQQIAEDFPGTARTQRPGRAGLRALLRQREVRPVTFEDWLRIDAAEIARATKPAPRKKFTTLHEMLRLAMAG